MVKQKKRRPTLNQAKKSILSLIEENQDRSIIELCRELPENRNGFDRRGHVCRTIIDEYFDNLPVEEQKELVLQLRERLPFDEYAAIERLDELEQRERAEAIILGLSSDATKQVRQFIDSLEPPDAESMVDAYMSLEVDEQDKFLTKTTNYQDVLDRFNLLPSDEQDAIIFDVQHREANNVSDGTLAERFQFDFTFCRYLQLRLDFSRDTLASILVVYHIVSDYVMREGRDLIRHFKRYGPRQIKDGEYVSLDTIQVVVLPEGMTFKAFDELPVDEQARFWLRSWAHFVIEKHKEAEWWSTYWNNLNAQIPTMIDYIQGTLPNEVAQLLEQRIKAAGVKAEYGDKIHPAIYSWLTLRPVDFEVLP